MVFGLKRFILALLVMAGLPLSAAAQSYDAFEQGREVTDAEAVLEFRDRIAPENAMTRDRLETLLPQLMDETGIDMWLVINREYAEDPVYFTLVPQPAFAARRTTILVFHKTDDAFDMQTVNRYPLGDPYEAVWEGG
ncbi:MAG: Xaa-Pro aminopeptidase, partial [Pseudomonadota bacterium]